ncbi:MAG: nucleoside-diphosphate-sugar epimerase [Planctomycetota bacterium]|jgi:nucleoside-diphosphate-sugar epimerase
MKRALVTGGGGFLGGAIVDQLLAEGYQVRSFSRGDYPLLRAKGVETIRGDLADLSAISVAAEGSDVVFHVAALAGIWGRKKDYDHANIIGTRNTLEAALRAKATRFVHTSSPSVCFDGKDHKRAGNTLPYSKKWLAHYPESKAAGERLVLAANGKGGLATVALRPHLIFGPGDPHLIPRLLERARAGRLAIVGDGENEVSMTFVGNAAHAHITAAHALESGVKAACAGQAYFVAQEEPVNLWEWVNELLQSLGEPPIKRRMPRRVAFAAGALCELAWNTLPLSGEPPMTRFVAMQLAASHSYDLSPLRNDIGYVEQVDMHSATARLVESLRAERGLADVVSDGASQ